MRQADALPAVPGRAVPPVSMTGCGETSERKAALMHGLVAGLYAVMLVWHVLSVGTHLRR